MQENKVGRPTKYNEEIPQRVREYISDYKINNKELPTYEELANLLDVNVDTIHEWKKHHEDFSDSLKGLLDLQKQRLMVNGLKGVFNPTMSIFLLKANHGMIETSRQEITGKDGEQLVGFNYLPPTDDNSNTETND